MTSRHQSRIRYITAMFASATVLILSAWLASVPGQAEDNTLRQSDTERKPVTCTDAAGIIYERGTPGFERCLTEMNQAAQAEAPGSEQAAKAPRARPSHRAHRRPRPTDTPTTTPTVAPEAMGTE